MFCFNHKVPVILFFVVTVSGKSLRNINENLSTVELEPTVQYVDGQSLTDSVITTKEDTLTITFGRTPSNSEEDSSKSEPKVTPNEPHNYENDSDGSEYPWSDESSRDKPALRRAILQRLGILPAEVLVDHYTEKQQVL